MLKVRFAIAFVGVAMLVLALPALQAQSSTAPLPSQILSAKKVFISNGGGEFDRGRWSGEPTRIYNQFYSAIKNWGHYELVGSIAEADLVLQISIVNSTRISGHVASTVGTQVRLTLLDPKTSITLWAINEYIPEKLTMLGGEPSSKDDRDKQLDDGISRVVTDLKTLNTPTVNPAVANH